MTFSDRLALYFPQKVSKCSAHLKINVEGMNEFFLREDLKKERG